MFGFVREHDKKVCILGLASLLAVPSAAMPAEVRTGLDQVFRALLKLLVAYKEQREGEGFARCFLCHSIPCRFVMGKMRVGSLVSAEILVRPSGLKCFVKDGFDWSGSFVVFVCQVCTNV
jgi:hypothetical protein